MKVTILALVFLSVAGVSLGNKIACKLGDKACKWWCRLPLGPAKSGGECNADGECFCHDDTVESYFCDADQHDEKFMKRACAGYCQFQGKQTGNCDTSEKKCNCVEEEFKGKHLQCLELLGDNVCSMICQAKDKKATGRCEGEHGWDCVCKDKDEVETSGTDEV